MISWYFPLFWFPELPTPVLPDPVNCKESCECELTSRRLRVQGAHTKGWPFMQCVFGYLLIWIFVYLCICTFVYLCICLFVYFFLRVQGAHTKTDLLCNASRWMDGNVTKIFKTVLHFSSFPPSLILLQFFLHFLLLLLPPLQTFCYLIGFCTSAEVQPPTCHQCQIQQNFKTNFCHIL